MITIQQIGAMMEIGFKDAVYYGTVLIGFGINIGITRQGLKGLKEQIIKQNGRVTKLEDRQLKHIEDYHTDKQK